MLNRQKNTGVRYAVLAIAFALICIAFIIALAVVQLKGPTGSFTVDSKNTRTITVSGLRGQIYDRNGKLLVGNSTSYSLIYEYGAMPSKFPEINAELLSVLDAMDATGETDKLCRDYFPLEGVYPNVRYISAISDTASAEYYYFEKVLRRHGYAPDISAEELAEAYIHRCKLDSELYSAGEIIDLMRFWYEMDRVDFGSYQPYTVAEGVSAELVARLEELGLSGVNFVTRSERVYNYPGIASHILGQLGKINAENAEYYTEQGYPLDAYVGVSGCELVFESILHGQDGKMVIEYDDGGNIVDKYYEVEPISGNDVWLTIDIDLQIAAEEALAETASSIEGAGGGALTAMDPNTGAVLAIASYPTYDLTRISETDYYASLLEDEKTPLLNRALGGTYAPGSTYKVGAALAALETGNTNTSHTCTCTGEYHSYGGPDCNDVHGRDVDISKAIEVSCNIFFYELGEKMGIDAMTDYTTRLGLGTLTGIELGDRAGTVAGPAYREENRGDAWGVRDDLSASIGQAEHSYTPLQLSVYMSSIVNGGTRYSAHLLDSVRHFYTKDSLSSYEVSVLDSVSFSDDTYQILINSMERVVSKNATVSHYFKNVPVAVGGKTGTAEVAGQADNALFCGFAPLSSPEIVVSCIIEKGQHGYYASAPVAKVMEEYFS